MPLINRPGPGSTPTAATTTAGQAAAANRGPSATSSVRGSSESAATTGTTAPPPATSEATTPITPAAAATAAAANVEANAAAVGANVAPTAEYKIPEISNKSDFDSIIAEAGNKLVIVEFYAQWCGPCKLISKKLEELAGKYEAEATVVKLDVDECEEVAVEYNVTSMPTFVFFRNKQKINQLVGSNGEKLFENVEKLCREHAAATSETARGPKTNEPAVKPTVK